MRFLDLFAGIGGFRLGMEMAGHTCVGYVEIDKFARQSYQAIHDTKGEWTAHDITTVTDEHIREFGRERGPIHVICGGFPCQSFSIAGKRGGFNDTRGTLFFEIMRFASILRPRYLFLENVEGLLNHDGGDTFEVILRTLDEVGYDAEWDVLNSSAYVPQNRERVFIIGHSRTERTRKIFPIGTNDTKNTKLQRQQILANTLTARYSQSLGQGSYVAKRKQHAQIIRAVVDPDREKKTMNGRRMKEPGEPMFTLTAQDKHGIYDSYRIRKLTPRECWRLQGFPDWAFDQAQTTGVSDSQLYKQAGNSVTVNVIHEIAKRLVE